MALLDDLGYQAPSTDSKQGGLLADLGASPQESKKEEPAISSHPVTDEVGNAISNIVKQLPRNAMNVAGTVADLPGDIWDMAFHPEEPPHPMAHLVANKLADRLEKSIPQLKPINQGSFERDIGAGIEGAGVGAIAGPEAIVPSAISGAASQTAKEAGYGPGVQFLAGMSPMAPQAIAGAIRGGVRGFGNAENMQANLAEAEKAGLSLSAGQLADKGATMATETGLSHLPGGGPLANTRGAALNNQVDARVSDIIQRIAPDTPKTAQSAGRTINAGVAKSREQMARDEDLAYAKVGHYIGDDTPVEAKNFASKATDLAHPTGIADIDKMLASPETVKAEAAGQAAQTPKQPPSYNPEWNSFQTQPESKPPLTFGQLRDMRARIGSSVDWGLTPANPGANAEKKQLYGALTEDIKTAAKKAGPEAQKALADANALYKSNTDKRNLLDTVVDKLGGPEEVYNAAVNKVKGGDTKIDTVMQQLDEDGRNVIRGTVLNRLGHVGGAVDAPFSADTYISNWNKLSPEAKDTLFGTGELKGGLRQGLDALSNTISRLQKQGYIKGGLATGVAQGNHGVMNGVMALLAERASEAGMHLLRGNPVGAAATIGGAGATLALNPAMSRFLTNPTTVKWLAQATQAPKGMIPVLLQQLKRNKDQDSQDLYQMIGEHQ